MQTYGCKVDSEDEEFSAKFDIAFDAIKNKLNSIEARRTVPKVKQPSVPKCFKVISWTMDTTEQQRFNLVTYPQCFTGVPTFVDPKDCD